MVNWRLLTVIWELVMARGVEDATWRYTPVELEVMIAGSVDWLGDLSSREQ
jgi:hypothetical protein